jgi:hypothetical protein
MGSQTKEREAVLRHKTSLFLFWNQSITYDTVLTCFINLLLLTKLLPFINDIIIMEEDVQNRNKGSLTFFPGNLKAEDLCSLNPDGLILVLY